MTPEETSDLLKRVAGRYPTHLEKFKDPVILLAWTEDLADVPLAVVKAALREMQQPGSEFVKFPPSSLEVRDACLLLVEADGSLSPDAAWDEVVRLLRDDSLAFPPYALGDRMDPTRFSSPIVYRAARATRDKIQCYPASVARPAFKAEYSHQVKMAKDGRVSDEALPDMTAAAEIAEHGGRREAPPWKESLLNARAHVGRAADNPAPTAPDPDNPTKPGRNFGYRTAVDDRQEPGRILKPINLDEWRHRADSQEGTGTE